MINTKEVTFISTLNDRVDKAASVYLPRSIFNQDDTKIYVNNKLVKKSYKVKVNDEVRVVYNIALYENINAENIPLNIIYEDDDILVIDKEQGMVVHPALNNYSGTLVNALKYMYGDDFETLDDDTRPGIVHRLDKDTSGVMIVAKNRDAHVSLANQFSSHTNEKVYISIVKGVFNHKRGTIDKNIIRNDKNRKTFTTIDNKNKGKGAITHYTVLKQYDSYAFLRVNIETGRTHQIRVHLKSINHPIVGDEIYSRKDNNFDENLLLHALKLTINHPRTGQRMSFYAKMPKRFRDVLLKLNDHT